jgi:hypothetical protein
MSSIQSEVLPADAAGIQRHKTAIRRASVSPPVKCLLRDGLLDPSRSLFDYGCGRGQDIELLQEQGIACDGWDPAYRPQARLGAANLVNLGYVINNELHGYLQSSRCSTTTSRDFRRCEATRFRIGGRQSLDTGHRTSPCCCWRYWTSSLATA